MNHKDYINKPIRVLALKLDDYAIGLYSVVADGETYSLEEVIEDTYLRRKIIEDIVSYGGWSFAIYCKKNF